MDSPLSESRPVPLVVDDEGYAIYPDCKERVHCGPSGIQNLIKRHQNKGTCKEAPKRKAKKPLKDSKLFGWLRPKPTLVALDSGGTGTHQ